MQPATTNYMAGRAGGEQLFLMGMFVGDACLASAGVAVAAAPCAGSGLTDCGLLSDTNLDLIL